MKITISVDEKGSQMLEISMDSDIVYSETEARFARSLFKLLLFIIRERKQTGQPPFLKASPLPKHLENMLTGKAMGEADQRINIQ